MGFGTLLQEIPLRGFFKGAVRRPFEAKPQNIGFSAPLEGTEQADRFGIKRLANPHQSGIPRRQQKGRHRQARHGLFYRKMPGRCQIDASKCIRHGVFGAHVVFAQLYPRREFQLRGPAVLGMGNRPRQCHVADNLVRLKRNAPCVQQFFQVRRHFDRSLAHCLFGFGCRINQNQQAPAAHQVLVNGVQGFVHETFRIDQHQNVNIGRNIKRLTGNEADIENIADLFHHGPAGQVFGINQIRRAAAVNRKRADDTDRRPFGTAQVCNVFRDVVFQKPFARRIQKRHDPAAVGRIGNSQPHVNVFGRISDRHTFQAVCQRFVLIF